MTIQFLLTLLLVFLNGFFVAAEFAIVKVRNSQIEVQKGVNQTLAKAAKSVTSNLDSYLAATQLGITLASLGLGWLGESVFTQIIQNFFDLVGIGNLELAKSLSVPTAFLLITILHIVLGELAPKSLAIRKPLPVTFGVAVPLHVFYWVFRPFIWMLNGLANILLHTIGLQPVHEQEDAHTEEELRIIIAESHKGGLLEETEKELIENVFNLGDRKIQTLMTPRNEITWINTQSTPEEIKKLIVANKHSAYPLCEGELNNVLGFVYSKDMMGDMFESAMADLKKIARPMQYILASNMAYSVLKKFQKQRIYQALIIDEFGSVRGIVTINDIIDALVGDISETDEFEYSSVRLSDGSLLVEGQIPFVEFLEKIGVEEDEEELKDMDYITLGGYILDVLERIPNKGDYVEWKNYKLTVLKMDHNRIDKVKVELL